MGYCVWFYNKNGQYYTTGCCNQEIDEHDYIGKHCTCCGKKIVIPIIQYGYNHKLKGELHHAN